LEKVVGIYRKRKLKSRDLFEENDGGGGVAVVREGEMGGIGRKCLKSIRYLTMKA
jgi:hypothetical protein